MSYLVTHTGAEGRREARQFESIEDAISHVEAARNSMGIEDMKVWDATEVPIAVRTYYKVELAATPSKASAPAAAAEDALRRPVQSVPAIISDSDPDAADAVSSDEALVPPPVPTAVPAAVGMTRPVIPPPSPGGSVAPPPARPNLSVFTNP